MDLPVRRAMTHEEFFDWAQTHEGRYEFDGCQPVAMTGGTANHGLISGNLMYQLKGRLRGTGCVPSGSDGPGVSTVNQKIRYPEAVVTCTKFGGRDRLIPNPVVVFEVLSDSTRNTDRFTKLREYHAVPSIRRYVLIEQEEIGITVHVRRADEPWTTTTLVEGSTLSLPEIGIELPLADLYDGVTFDDGEAN